MRLRIHQISLRLDYEKADVLAAIAGILGCREDELDRLVLLRRSIDARRADLAPRFVLSVDVDYSGENEPPLKPGRVLLAEEEPTPEMPRPSARKLRPVVVGAGPAGLMAAMTLAEAGWTPLLIERGSNVRIRGHHVETFWQEGVLNPESNVLYGEGGAGLFSDGKLTARSKDRGAIRRLFQQFVDYGASPDILIDAEPHIGTDVLQEIIPRLRARIEELGGEVRFGAKLEGLRIEGGRLRGLVVSGQEIETDLCFLATGHSARDVYAMLAESDVRLAAKPFAVGVRIEMPQRRINAAQYGRWANHPRLGSAGFHVTRKPGKATRACYSFCNCPGGWVMACASMDGALTTNGMSESKRDRPFGNAAMLVPVGPADYPIGLRNPDLAGLVFQETIERAAFRAGGSNYALPAQPLIEFLAGIAPPEIPDERSCTRAVAADVSSLLPDEVARTLREVLPKMLRELDTIDLEDVLVYGAETRSSSPVRIPRDALTRQSPSVVGLYPIGEGSGHTGGIVSSALDGEAAALHALQT